MYLKNNESNCNTLIAVALMCIGMWLFGSVVTTVFITNPHTYDTALKNNDWFTIIISIGWIIYCFCIGYLKWKSIKD